MAGIREDLLFSTVVQTTEPREGHFSLIKRYYFVLEH